MPIPRSRRSLGSIAALVAVVALLAGTASPARAQCAFEHPRKATKLQGGLVQAFLCATCACGGTPNTTTSGGVPSCAPPVTYNQAAGSPPEGWLWDERKANGSVTFRAAKNKLVDPLNDPADSADMTIALKMSGVHDLGFGPASGDGFLAVIGRVTFKDHGGSDMTVVDFPLGVPFTLTNGKASLKTSVNARLNSIMQPGLPKCTSIEIVAVNVIDEYGSTFASFGTFLP